MAKSNKQRNRQMVGAAIGLVVGYVVYTEIQKAQKAQALQQAEGKGPAQVLETITSDSPTSGVGAKSIVVNDPGEPRNPNACSNFGINASWMKILGLCT